MLGSNGYANAAQPMLNQLQGLANQRMSGTLQQHAQYHNAQQQAAHQYNQTLMAGLGRYRKEYMIDGRAMTFEEFVNELAPGEDNSLRSWLILKYKK